LKTIQKRGYKWDEKYNQGRDFCYDDTLQQLPNGGMKK